MPVLTAVGGLSDTEQDIAIYGHHLTHSSAMFSSLVKYRDSGYCAAHSIIQLYTVYGERTYRISAIVNMQVGDWDAAAADFASGRAFQAYVDRARAKALYDSGAAAHSASRQGGRLRRNPPRIHRNAAKPACQGQQRFEQAKVPDFRRGIGKLPDGKAASGAH